MQGFIQDFQLGGRRIRERRRNMHYALKTIMFTLYVGVYIYNVCNKLTL